ncbi:MAG: hypothetical protein ACTIA5_13635 [Brachybacterium tyrofermentans]|uniref:Tetratricopeptide repeat protein n=1 Tax=Brachybacterium tyrofermentans TaxID=47848 RepID=A0ABW0FAM2_9MICO|nr:hypothetical protein FM103_00045 [Corynebacterium xerosis]
MSTPQQRVHDTTRRLLELLASDDSHTPALVPEAIALRTELAVATAETGQLEDAFVQVDELLKDAQREYGPDHELVGPVRAAVSRVETLARRALDEG